MDKALKDRTDLLISLFDNILLGITVWSRDGTFLFANKAFGDLFGDIGHGPPGNMYIDKKMNREVFKTMMGGSQWIGEVAMLDKNQKTLNILLKAYALKNENDQIIGLVGTYMDMTRQKQAEKALLKSEQQMRAILEASPDPIVMYDKIGHPRYINPAFTKVFGWTLDELKKKIIPFVPQDQEELTGQKIREIYTYGKPLSFETRRVTKDHRTLDIFLSAAVTKTDDGIPTGMVVNLTDVTEKKALEVQYEQAQKMESLGTLAGGIAHDFNNLLSGIFGYLDLARKLTKEPDVAEFLTKAFNTSERAKGLTRQLLTFSKGGVPVKEIEPLVPFLQETTEFALSGANVSCSFALPRDLWLCDYDKNQIGQVIDNIIINAQQAMPAGGNIQVTASNEILREKEHPGLNPGKYVKISISDTGTGIPEKYITRIFDPFFTTKQKGSGLGLATSYSIVKHHDGIIDVESRQGTGTMFHTFLPAAEHQEIKKKATVEKTYQGSGSILVMDDDDMVREMLIDMLTTMGFTATPTSEGLEAVETFNKAAGQDKEFCAVILDLTVPGGMGGKETIKEIRKINKNIPVFVASGYSEDAAIANPKDFGFTASLQKPFAFARLARMFEKYL
ncbi:MAG: PAS domain S-box protein [Deltaproteobacteria bacterium]|nr:PAS domain S-box protein [Deltaproteobacteria bacterium]